MKPAVITSLLLLSVATRADEKGHQVKFTAHSVQSDIFAPLRVNKTTVLTSGCGKAVTEPLGILEQTFKRGSVKNGEQCTWKLHAPVNQVVNIISLIFVLEDEIKPNRTDDETYSIISLYDGLELEEKNELISYAVTDCNSVSYFNRSTSSNEDMVVQIKYHDHKYFATQKILINYEFLEYKKMQELIRTYNTTSSDANKDFRRPT